MDYEPPPARLVAAAEQDYHGMRDRLSRIKKVTGDLLNTRHSEVEAVVDLWSSFVVQDPDKVAFLAATTIVQFVRAEGHGPAPTSEEGPRCA